MSIHLDAPNAAPFGGRVFADIISKDEILQDAVGLASW